MSRYRATVLGLAGAVLGLLSGCRSTNPCCEPPREGLLVRLGLRPSAYSNGYGGPVIGTTVSSPSITSGGFYSGPVYGGPVESGPIMTGPITSGPIMGTMIGDGFGTVPPDGPFLPPAGTLPPGALPPGMLPYPGAIPPMPPAGGGFAKPTPADPAGRYKY
ncbi:MAG: hypothetical protein K2W96_11655 [Gemmataceae bacterium]|nr:hypothetical protein [Gemmataceae bacterium]